MKEFHYLGHVIVEDIIDNYAVYSKGEFIGSARTLRDAVWLINREYSL